MKSGGGSSCKGRIVVPVQFNGSGGTGIERSPVVPVAVNLQSVRANDVQDSDDGEVVALDGTFVDDHRGTGSDYYIILHPGNLTPYPGPCIPPVSAGSFRRNCIFRNS